jgi:hypothetical protein
VFRLLAYLHGLAVPSELFAAKKTMYSNLIEAGYGQEIRKDFIRKIAMLGIEDPKNAVVVI